MKIKVTALPRPGHVGVKLPAPVNRVLLEGETVELEIDSLTDAWATLGFVSIETVSAPEAVVAEKAPARKAKRARG